MSDEENDVAKISPQMGDALRKLAAGVGLVMEEAINQLHPPVHAVQVREAVRSGQCTLTLQFQVPGNTVCVIADGDNWIEPQVVFALEGLETK